MFSWCFSCLCFSGISPVFLAPSVSMKSCWNITFAFLCHLVRRDTNERTRSWAIKSTCPVKKIFFHAGTFQIPLALSPALCSRICFSSSGSDLSSTVSTSAVFLPEQRLPVSSSHPGQRWDEEARIVRPYVDPRLISRLAAEAQASAVYNLRLSGCSSTAAAGLQLSSCCFPALPHVWAKPPQFSLSPG